ncbi:MAG TPA: hypothetical protein VK506_02060 [Conexibacter sp.]|nr:hypothetical protein [Conexibacter sp.]
MATTTSTAPTTTPGRGGRASRAREAAQSCAALGISQPPYNEGACTQDGVRFVVANGRSLLSLRTLSLALQGFSVTEELRRAGQRATPQGVYILVSVKVRNLTSAVQHVAVGQTLLTMNEQEFVEAEAAERIHPGALAFAQRATIGPGEVVTGVVIFDIPLSEIERVTRDGVLLVANFGADREAARRGSGPSQIGQIRIGVP